VNAATYIALSVLLMLLMTGLGSVIGTAVRGRRER
jgi:hypothetical protein